MGFWSEARENYILPALVPIGSIKEIKGSYPVKGWLNYDCDWQLIYEEVVKVIKGLAISRETKDRDNLDVFDAKTIIGGESEVYGN